MSRIGKKPITLPDKVEVKVQNKHVVVKGPLGQLEYHLPAAIDVTLEGHELLVKRPTDEREHRALHGLARSLLANMVHGVSAGFTRNLLIDGVGYRAQTQGTTLVMSLGYSHPIEFIPPEGIKISVEKNKISITGIDKQAVGQVAANIREFRPVEPYKGKGIRYEEEKVRRKVGKVGT